MSERLARKQSRARMVLAIASMLMAIPSAIYVGYAVWESENARVIMGGIVLVVIAFAVIAHYGEDKHDRMWREIGEELERDRKPD